MAGRRRRAGRGGFGDLPLLAPCFTATCAKWNSDEVRDDLREYVVEHLADEATGVLIVDETGFLKKGHKSVGVARQYTGTAGDTVNCQVGVFLTYSSEKGAAFLDRALYLPRTWTNDPARSDDRGGTG